MKEEEKKNEADEMHEIRQDQLTFMIESCYMGGMFPSIILTQKDGKLFSIQREDDDRALRFFKWHNFSDEEILYGSIELDAKLLLQTFKLCKEPKSLIGLKGNRFHIINGDREFSLMYREPEGEVKMKLPFEIKDGVPMVGEKKKPLDTHVVFKTSYFKELASIANVLKTEFFTFAFDDSFSVTLGELHDTSDKTKLNIDCEFCGPKHVESVYTYGMAEMSKGFNQPTTYLNFTSKAPGWFYQISKDHVLGIFLPPYNEQED